MSFDPLYDVILIALTQGTRKITQHVSLFVPRGSKNEYSSDTVWKVYTADITLEYLRKFDDPFQFHAGSLNIVERTMPLEDIHLLPRLIQEASYGVKSTVLDTRIGRKSCR